MNFRFEPVAAGCGLVLLFGIYAMVALPMAQRLILIATLAFAYAQLRRDRWAMARTNRWSYVRKVYQSLSIYHFAWRLDKAYKELPVPEDSLELYPTGEAVLDKILESGPQTFQAKPTNRVQIESLMDCVCALVPEIRATGATPLVLDIGAGKALFTRAVYEALDRKVAAVALDSRRQHAKDQFYDPTPSAGGDDATYTRVVADVRYLAAKTIRPLKGAKGGVISITKHLCGGATDGSLMALCAPPLDEYVGACCFAPCCHQKTRRNQYCNMAYLESLGFCQTHLGLRGELQDPDFKTFGMLICMSRVTDLLDFEYSKSTLLKLLGFKRARDLGRKARRLFEEGRMRYLRDHGFDAHLVRYCDESITGDNLAIIARRRTT
jgi:hypothetical protein